MTDKAAREAFEKLVIANGWANDYADDVEDVFLAGYQAAHDAAMAAEPDVQRQVSEIVEVRDAMLATGQRDAAAVLGSTCTMLESLALQLQAAHARRSVGRRWPNSCDSKG